MTLEFVSISLIHERKLFPTIYMVLDPKNLEVWCKMFVLDEQVKRDLPLEKVKDIVGMVLNVNTWEQERDITHRCWELYGIINLNKVKKVDDN